MKKERRSRFVSGLALLLSVLMLLTLMGCDKNNGENANKKKKPRKSATSITASVTESTPITDEEGSGADTSAQDEENATTTGTADAAQTTNPIQTTASIQITASTQTTVEKVSVLNVVGRPLDEATETLRGQGFSVQTEYKVSDEIPEGTVINQSVEPGQLLEKGKTIQLTIASARTIFEVGSVTNYSKTEAISLLEKQGFKVSIKEQYHSSVESGRVISQSPAAGTYQQKGSTIIITLSKGKQPVSVKLNANGGKLTTDQKTVYLSSTYGSLPKPTRDYYTFMGWYTASSGGNKISDTTKVSDANSHTLYAQWQMNSVSGWVLATDVPSGAQIVSQKWTYTKTETKSSSSSSLSGWTQTGSYWEKTESGTHYYTSYPSGFDKNDSLYSKYSTAALSAYTDETTKREVSSASRHSYIYWHWNAVLGQASKPNNRQIGSYKGASTGSGFATHFAAFEDATDYGHKDSKGNICDEFFCNRGNYTDVSWWWFRFEVYKQTYTEYQKVYTYKKTTSGESTTEVSASNTISNVQKWVQYRAK